MIAPRLVLVLFLVALAVAGGCRRTDPGSVKAELIAAADALAAENKFTEAATSYRKAVAVDPMDGALRLKLARALEGAQAWTAAANEAMRASDLRPDDADARRLAARLVLGQGRFEDTLSLVERLLAAAPDDVDLLVLAGTAHARLINSTWALYKLAPTGGAGPDYERGCTSLRPSGPAASDREAETLLRRAVALAPRSIETRLALVNFLWAVRRPDDGESMLRQLADELPGHALISETAGRYYAARGRADDGRKYLANAAAAPDPYSRVARFALADRHLEEGRYDDALAVLDTIDAARDEGGVVTIRKAEAQLRLGRLDDAARTLDGLIARYPADARALAFKAEVLVAKGDAVAAIEPGRQAVRADPALAQAHEALGAAYHAAGDLDGAFDEYAEALRESPARAELPLLLAQLALATGRDSVALGYARDAAGRFPHDLEARLLLVEALTRSGDLPAADVALAPLLALRPPPAEVLVPLARLQAARGDLAAARATYERAQATSGGADAIGGLVDLDLAEGAIPQARRRVDAAIAAAPRDAARHRLAARVSLAAGDRPAAMSALRATLALQPADTEAMLLLAEQASASGDHTEARRLIDLVMRRRPAWARAQAAMGLVLERLGLIDLAVAQYETTLSGQPGEVTAATRLALIDVAARRSLVRALGVVTAAQRIAPKDPAVLDALGWVHLHRDRPDLALPLLEAAVTQTPDDGERLYHLGVGYSRAGRTEDARRVLRRALVPGRTFAWRADAEAALAALATRGAR